MLAILKMPGSFTSRERIARDMQHTIRPRLKIRNDRDLTPEELQRMLLGVRLVWTLTKFNLDFLTKTQHADVLESLRYRWVKVVDATDRTAVDIPDLKRLYRKIMKCLLAYCRSEASDKQVLFDLLKGFSYQSLIDLSPMLSFFTEEVPKFTSKR